MARNTQQSAALSTASKMFTPLSLAAILAAAIVPYVSTWSDAFIADDWVHLLHSKNLTPSTFLHNCSFSPDDLYYRPVAIAYFHANYLLWGLEPTGYHAVKGVLFAATAVLLFLFILRATGLRVAALAAGLVFAVQPLNASCGIWLSTHANVLCAFFYLLALLLFVEARKRGRGGLPYYAGFLAAMLLAFGSYELAYTLPIAVMLADLLLTNRDAPQRWRLAGAWKWHAPYLAIAAAFLAVRSFHMGMTGVEVVRTGGEAGLRLPEALMTIFMPVGQTESLMPLWIRVWPIIGAGVALAAAFVFGRRLRKAAAFAAIMLALGSAPAYRQLSCVPDLGNTRLLTITMLGFALLVGVYASTLWQWRAGRIAAIAGIVVLLGVYLRLGFDESAKWHLVAAQSDAVMKGVMSSCRNETEPFRLAFVTCPRVQWAYHYTEPKFLVSAFMVLTGRAPIPETLRWTSPYLRGHYDISRYSPEVREEITRWFPIRFDGGAFYESPVFRKIKDDSGRMLLDNLARTFFFYWDGAALHNCTAPMLGRLTEDRTKPLFSWTARDDYPNPHMFFSFGEPNPSYAENVLYFLPTAGERGGMAAIQINLHGVMARDFDQIEITMSAASKSDDEGYFTGKIAWKFKREEETPEMLDRAEPFLGRYYRFHAMEKEKMNHYRILLAQQFMDADDREIEAIYIVLPNRFEYAIRDIRLTRFTEYEEPELSVP